MFYNVIILFYLLGGIKRASETYIYIVKQHKHSRTTMKTIKHNSTGTIFQVTEIAPKTIYMTVLSLGENSPKYIKVGSKQKTTPAAIAIQYTIID